MGDFEHQPIARGSVEPVAGPAERAPVLGGGGCNGGGHGAEQLIVAQHANTGEHRLADLQVLALDGGLRRDAVQRAPAGVGVVDGHRRTAQPEARPVGVVHEPETHAAVAGRKGDQDARVGSGAQQQMRRNVAFAHEAVEVETFLNFEVEPWRRRLRRRSCHWPHEDGNDNGYLCVRRRPSGELHFTPCASLETERGRDCSASIASCLPHA